MVRVVAGHRRDGDLAPELGRIRQVVDEPLAYGVGQLAGSGFRRSRRIGIFYNSRSKAITIGSGLAVLDV